MREYGPFKVDEVTGGLPEAQVELMKNRGLAVDFSGNYPPVEDYSSQGGPRLNVSYPPELVKWARAQGKDLRGGQRIDPLDISKIFEAEVQRSSFEFGKAGCRHKVFYANEDELVHKIKLAKKAEELQLEYFGGEPAKIGKGEKNHD